MVFIPSVSTFAISRLLGGGKTMLLGDLIEMQFYGNYLQPLSGQRGIALVMMVIVLICMAIMNRFGDGEETAVRAVKRKNSVFAPGVHDPRV